MVKEFRLWGVLAASTLLVGDVIALVTLPLGSSISISLLGALAGVYLVSAGRGDPRPRWLPQPLPRVRYLVAVPVLGSLAIVAVLAQFGGVGALWLLTLGGCSPPVLRWLARRSTSTSTPHPPKAAYDTQPSTRVHLATMSEVELCRQWARSYVALERVESPTLRAAIVATRSALLTELERRDPRGFARWIASGARAASNPQRFIAGADPVRDPPAG